MPLSRHRRDGRTRQIKGLEIVKSGALVQLGKTPASHAGGRGSSLVGPAILRPETHFAVKNRSKNRTATEELAETLFPGPTHLGLQACHDGQRRSTGRLPSQDLNRPS